MYQLQCIKNTNSVPQRPFSGIVGAKEACELWPMALPLCELAWCARPVTSGSSFPYIYTYIHLAFQRVYIDVALEDKWIK